MARTARRLRVLTSAAVAGLAAHDLRQRRHAILRNFPVIGNFRYLLESVGPSFGSTSSREQAGFRERATPVRM